MTSWREMERIRRDPEGFRSLARVLAAHDDLTPWEDAFLSSIARLQVEQFSLRQSEKLLEIRDDRELVETIRGFSIKSLMRDCYYARNDLSEADEEWLVALWQRGETKIKRKAAVRLLKCAEQLSLVEAAS